MSTVPESLPAAFGVDTAYSWSLRFVYHQPPLSSTIDPLRSEKYRDPRDRRSLVIAGLLILAAGSHNDDGPIVGIDLGTTFSCVAVYRNGRAEVIPNSQGGRTTASWVSFRGAERLVGDAAKHAYHSAPAQTIFSIKRIIGREYEDAELQQEVKRWPFDVVDQGGRPSIQIYNDDVLQTFAPEEISAMILGKMKQTAETYLGKKVTRAVVTVPAYFNDAQRQATKDAGAIAGLNIIRMVNEPTAAALAYGSDRKMAGSSLILVYDFGGGTLDVSLLWLVNGAFKVLATSGDAHLGGEDLDHNVVDYFVDKYRRSTGADVSTNHRSMSKLKKEVERAKRILSTESMVTLEIEGFHRGRDFAESLTRAKFEQLNQELFQKALVPVRQVLKDAKLGTSAVDEILLVGGSTRIPKVQSMLRDMFRGKTISQGIHPDEAVALGAAIHAGILSNEAGLEDLTLADVCPFTVGIETSGGHFTPFINRNSPVPAMHMERVSTMADNQQVARIQVYEGENSKTKYNHLIGEFELTGLQPSARGITQIDIQFDLDVNGILRVEATERSTGKSKALVITTRRWGLSQEELHTMAQKSEQLDSQEITCTARSERLNEITKELWDLEEKLQTREFRAALAEEGRHASILETIIEEAMIWLEENGSRVTLEELNENFKSWSLPNPNQTTTRA
ncbi:ATPase with role in protein import into the ER [Ceratobasidium sp. 423]|nr:ATPase with role in protein import into the ER [Ceratobasidium sp. 423]